MRLRMAGLVVASALAIVTCGCDHRSPVAPLPAAPTLGPATADLARTAAVAATSAQHEEGTIGPGALYSFDVPEAWNGGLVLFEHGYSFPQSPVALPDVAPLRDFWLQQGYAVAISSFSENGWAVAEATRQSHQLLGMFADRYGEPGTTLVVGVSMGGLVALALTERYPDQIDGSLLVSGVVGGARAEVNFIGDVRLLWDELYPGSIPGSLFDVPEGVPFDPNWVLAAISTPEGQQKLPILLAFAAARGLPIGPGNEPVEGLIRALGFHWMGAMDLFDRTHGRVLYDNANVVYTAPGVPQATVDEVNAGIARYDATADAEAYLDRCYEPSGRIQVPVFTLHGTRDPNVPIFHEQLFAEKVARQGRSQFLHQRSVAVFGHVVYPADAIPQAFLDLVNWMNSGAKPVA